MPLAGEVIVASDAGAGSELAYAEITAASAAFTTVADISGLSISFTLASTRTVYIKWGGLVRSTIASDIIDIAITDNTPTTLVNSSSIFIPAANASVRTEFGVRKSLVAGTYNYKIRGTRTSGTGTTNVNALTTSVSYIQALDITSV